MKFVFVGPSLPTRLVTAHDVLIKPPAAKGDIFDAALAGATIIGLIDGTYDTHLSVWHKEILFALSRGIRVLGASSMGALRAAECQAYGMEPVGKIAQGFVAGLYDDDSDVALLHAPKELGWVPITEPIVDVWATVENLVSLNEISECQATQILSIARSIHFKKRTTDSLFGAIEGGCELKSEYLKYHTSQKKIDALHLIAKVNSL